jgi:GTPase SAR1 family protein
MEKKVTTVIGQSGVGKSFLVQKMLIEEYYNENLVFIIDRGRSYNHFIEMFGSRDLFEKIDNDDFYENIWKNNKSVNPFFVSLDLGLYLFLEKYKEDNEYKRNDIKETIINKLNNISNKKDKESYLKESKKIEVLSSLFVFDIFHNNIELAKKVEPNIEKIIKEIIIKNVGYKMFFDDTFNIEEALKESKKIEIDVVEIVKKLEELVIKKEKGLSDNILDYLKVALDENENNKRLFLLKGKIDWDDYDLSKKIFNIDLGYLQNILEYNVVFSSLLLNIGEKLKEVKNKKIIIVIDEAHSSFNSSEDIKLFQKTIDCFINSFSEDNEYHIIITAQDNYFLKNMKDECSENAMFKNEYEMREIFRNKR